MRHAIEEQYYLDACIRTQRFVLTPAINRLDRNLHDLFLHQETTEILPIEVEKEVEERIRSTLSTGEPPISVLLSISHRHDCALQTVQKTFYRILWERRVRVELMDEMVLLDRPLKPERTDVLKHFDYLFAREA